MDKILYIVGNRIVYRILVGKLEGELDIGGMTDLKEIVYEGVDWIQLVQDSDYWQGLMNILLNLWVP
jgi:hypothetical protein